MDFAGLQLYPGKRTVTQIGFYSNIKGMLVNFIFEEYERFAFKVTWIPEYARITFRF
jgi:hypothetical protein